MCDSSKYRKIKHLSEIFLAGKIFVLTINGLEEHSLKKHGHIESIQGLYMEVSSGK